MPQVSDRSVIILGPQNLQNSVLSSFINDVCSTPCHILSSSLEIRTKQSVNDLLILIDSSSLTFSAELLNPFYDTAKIALINTEDDQEIIFQILTRFNLHGVFPKCTTPEQFVQGINVIFANEYWFSGKLINNILNQMKLEIGLKRQHDFGDNEVHISDLLTAKESRILEALVDGHTNQDIADKIFLSPHTVKTHIYNLYKKIGVTNRVQAANWARTHLNKAVEIR